MNPLENGVLNFLAMIGAIVIALAMTGTFDYRAAISEAHSAQLLRDERLIHDDLIFHRLHDVPHMERICERAGLTLYRQPTTHGDQFYCGAVLDGTSQ